MVRSGSGIDSSEARSSPKPSFSHIEIARFDESVSSEAVGIEKSAEPAADETRDVAGERVAVDRIIDDALRTEGNVEPMG
jgi:hypothetical protein